MRSVPHPSEAAINSDDNHKIKEDEGGGEAEEGTGGPKNDEEKHLSIAVLTQTTPTLTPTRIQNIEEDFFHALQVKPPETHVHQAGFIPPLVRVISRDYSAPPAPVALPELVPIPFVTMPTENPKTTPKKRRSSRATGSGDPEEDLRRKLRRERNKQAAARCRKRRMDQTQTLQVEVDDLEEKRQSLQNEIMALQSQKNELERILLGHSCRMDLKPKAKPVRPTSLALSMSLTSAASSATLSEPMDLATPSKGLNLFESDNWPVLTPTALSLLDTPGNGSNNGDSFLT